MSSVSNPCPIPLLRLLYSCFLSLLLPHFPSSVVPSYTPRSFFTYTLSCACNHIFPWVCSGNTYLLTIRGLAMVPKRGNPYPLNSKLDYSPCGNKKRDRTVIKVDTNLVDSVDLTALPTNHIARLFSKAPLVGSSNHPRSTPIRPSLGARSTTGRSQPKSRGRRGR